MKKFIALLLALVMGLTLVACAGGSDPAAEPGTDDPAPLPEPITEEPGPEPEPEPVDEEIVVAGIVFQDDQFMNMLTKGYEDAAAVRC